MFIIYYELGYKKRNQVQKLPFIRRKGEKDKYNLFSIFILNYINQNANILKNIIN